MKTHISTLSVSALAAIAHQATHQAAQKAVAAGRTIACWENGRLVEYGRGALPLPGEFDDVQALGRLSGSWVTGYKQGYNSA